MLVEFSTKNYKSFVDKAKFSMLAAPKQKGLDYSLCINKIKGNEIKGLSSSVIYGPNASGKTNIIGAMDVFRTIVLRGNINNSEEKLAPNPASASLELIPNKDLHSPQPVEFLIKFIEEKMLIEYSLTMDLGKFLNIEYKRKIIQEKLIINEEPVFIRTKDLFEINLKAIKQYISNSVDKKVVELSEIAIDSINPEELFLTNGFKLIFSQTLTKIIIDWFMNKFMVIYRADSMQLIRRFSDPKKKAMYIEKTIDKAARLFGINSNALGYVVSEEDKDAKLCSLFQDNKKASAMAAEIFESYGTIRFINLFPLVIRAIQTGGTLVVDEFDASIHPMALMSIINIFHNNDINIHHAQLIFNTHNPIFLNSNLLRRDEIKFVERDDESHYSKLYSLSDFGTSGDKGVRKHADYMKNYFISEYGAIKDIDFTPIFEEIITSESGV